MPVLTGIGHEKDDSIVDLVAHTRLKTPTAVAEFIINGVSTFEERINLLEQTAIEIVEDQMEEEKSRLANLTREISAMIRSQLKTRNGELMQQIWKSRQETKLALQVKDHQLSKKMQRMGFLVDHYLFVRRQNIIRAQHTIDVSIPRITITMNQRLDEYIEKFRRLSLKHLEKEKYRIDIASQKGAMSDPQTILKKGYSITTFQGRMIKDLAILKNAETIKTQFFEGSVLSKIVEIVKTDKNDD